MQKPINRFLSLASYSDLQAGFTFMESVCSSIPFSSPILTLILQTHVRFRKRWIHMSGHPPQCTTSRSLVPVGSFSRSHSLSIKLRHQPARGFSSLKFTTHIGMMSSIKLSANAIKHTIMTPRLLHLVGQTSVYSILSHIVI